MPSAHPANRTSRQLIPVIAAIALLTFGLKLTAAIVTGASALFADALASAAFWVFAVVSLLMVGNRATVPYRGGQVSATHYPAIVGFLAGLTAKPTREPVLLFGSRCVSPKRPRNSNPAMMLFRPS